MSHGKPEMPLSPACPLGWTTVSLECQTNDSQLLPTGRQVLETQDGSLRKRQRFFASISSRKTAGLCSRDYLFLQ